MKLISKMMGPLITAIGVFLTPIIPLLILVGCFIGLDTVTGIFKAIKLKEVITSRKFGQVIIKMLIYQLVILTMYGLDILILGTFFKPFFPETEYIFTKLVTFVLIASEVKSIDENFKVIFNFSFIELFRNLLKEIRNDVKTIKEIKDLKK